MADKNNIADEDYLDNLLKAITGEADGAADKINDDELDFDSVLKEDSSEEEFLSDFEKEFFDESESEMLGDVFDDIPDTKTQAANITEEPVNIPDDMLFDVDNDILDEFDDTSLALDEEISEPAPVAQAQDNNAKELVEQAVNQADSSVEEDLQGLYGILGVDNAEDGIPDDVEDKPKKKGLFGRKGKKDKKEKKSKKSQENAGEGVEDIAFDMPSDMENSENAENTDNGLDGFDVESLFDSVGAEASGGDDFGGQDAFGLALDDSAESDLGGADGFDFGLDDSSFSEEDMDENEMLIRQMEEGELDDDELLNSDEGGKKKGKKGKKEKKEKVKKEKAPKKPKEKKPKKEKAPKEKKFKEPDEIIHIPIVAILFMLSFIVVAVLAAKLGGDYYYYEEKIFDAVSIISVEPEDVDVDEYESRYSEAYRLLNGLEMKKNEHKALYDYVETVMFMDTHYEAYKNYMLLEDFDHGLDSLVKAVKMYDKYRADAIDLGCQEDMDEVLSWVEVKLRDIYGLTVSEAREISLLTDDNEYAVKVRTVAAEARSKYENMNPEEE